jgi:hypothetical protein
MVEETKLPIIWDKVAKTQVKKAYNKMLKESCQGGITVRNGILDAVEEKPEHFYKYPADRLKENNEGNYRAFELYSYSLLLREKQTFPISRVLPTFINYCVLDL